MILEAKEARKRSQDPASAAEGVIWILSKVKHHSGQGCFSIDLNVTLSDDVLETLRRMGYACKRSYTRTAISW